MEDLMTRILQVARSRKAARVTTVRVRLGVLSHMTPRHFEEHFVDASRGTIAEGAAVVATEIPETGDPLARDIVLDSIDVLDGIDGIDVEPGA